MPKTSTGSDRVRGAAHRALRRGVIPLLALAFIAADRPCHAAPPPVFRPQSGFAFLEAMRGTWAVTAQGKSKPYVMTYDIASRGSIVTEQFDRELSVFYLDGDRLLMTHFCNAGNQPRLRLRPGTRAGVLDFVMIDITGLQDPKDAHVREAVYQLIDADTVKLSLIWTGKDSGAPEEYTLKRRT